MKKLGLVGGVGPASTVEYYKGINEEYQKHVKSTSISGENPPMVIDSLNLAVAYDLVERKSWAEFADLFIQSIKRLQSAGAEFAAISANTAHIVFDEIREKAPIPVLGIVDEACGYAQQKNCKRLIVFGTGFTMSSGMYEKACARYGIEAIVPDEADRNVIHNIIFPNLESGIVLADEKNRLLEIAERLIAEHKADGLVLGCTELPLAIKEGDLDTVLIDTTKAHVDAIIKEILS